MATGPTVNTRFRVAISMLPVAFFLPSRSVLRKENHSSCSFQACRPSIDPFGHDPEHVRNSFPEAPFSIELEEGVPLPDAVNECHSQGRRAER